MYSGIARNLMIVTFLAVINLRDSRPRPLTDEWDAVVCCFFIDTAHNVIDYLERIYHILKPGGLWINFGQLVVT